MYNVYTCTCIDPESSVEAPISRQPEVDSSSRPEDDFDLDEETELDFGEPSAAQIVEAGIAQGQLDVSSIPTDQSTLDEAEETLIQEFVRVGCKCDLGPNQQPSSTTITMEHFRSVRCQMAELSCDELDLVVVGQVMAGCFSETISHTVG